MDEYYVEYEGGVLCCPKCGRRLGSFSNAHTRMRDQCGAVIELCAGHEHEEDK